MRWVPRLEKGRSHLPELNLEKATRQHAVVDLRFGQPVVRDGIERRDQILRARHQIGIGLRGIIRQLAVVLVRAHEGRTHRPAFQIVVQKTVEPRVECLAVAPGSLHRSCRFPISQICSVDHHAITVGAAPCGRPWWANDGSTWQPGYPQSRRSSPVRETALLVSAARAPTGGAPTTARAPDSLLRQRQIHPGAARGAISPRR